MTDPNRRSSLTEWRQPFGLQSDFSERRPSDSCRTAGRLNAGGYQRGSIGTASDRTERSCRRGRAAAASCRRGQSLVEFAVIALALYMLLAAILTFGHLLYVAQGLQTAADLAAREISRTPLPAFDTTGVEPRPFTFEDALTHPTVLSRIYDPSFLVFDLDTLEEGQSFLEDVIADWPLLNRQLASMMIVDRPDLDGDGVPDANLIRYPGALLEDSSSPTGFVVGIPLIVGRSEEGVETIRWVPVVQEIEPDDESHPLHDPFSITNEETRGIVALRINYPFQSASMSSFRPNVEGPFEPTLGQPNVADDEEVVQLNEPPGELTGAPLASGGLYRGTYGGQYGLGAQGALGSAELTGGRPVRPFRRVVSAQAIYRREVFQ